MGCSPCRVACLRDDISLFLPLSLSLSFSGEATFDKGKFIDGLNGASKLVRGFATIVDKGAGAMVSLKDRLGPRS